MEQFWQDSNEPSEMEMLLVPSIPNLIVASLNQHGFGDYKFNDCTGKTRQWERKQIGEALGDLDSAEEQLNRELATCDELTLVVEGVWQPTPRGVLTFKCYNYGEYCKVHKSNSPHYCPGYEFDRQPALAARYEGLKWGLRHAGIEVVETPCMEVTAQALVAAYRASQKVEHTTLRRYVRPHIEPFNPNPHVQNLMNLKGANIGPVHAQKLVEAYGTTYNAMAQDYHRLAAVIGKADARKFMEAVGRKWDASQDRGDSE